MSRLLINQYYTNLDNLIKSGSSRSQNSLRRAFANLLNEYCKSRNFTLVDDLYYQTKLGTKIRIDGIIKDSLRLDWGYWESKDTKDNLDLEIEAKISKGYPTDNILFEDTNTAVLYQNHQEIMRISMKDRDALNRIINLFLDYERPEVTSFRTAIQTFNEDLPTILNTLRDLVMWAISPENNSANLLKIAHPTEFKKKFEQFLELCKESINPDITQDDIREMIIQHILTEDIFINIFNEGQFHRENNIAKALHELIDTFFTGDLKRNTLKTIDSYYTVIIRTTSQIIDYQEKQKFLKVVYENFYQAYNPKAADRLGIVYTPNEIVNFMIESTDYLLEKHFNKLLGDSGVEILDPATGTGTFITKLIDYLPSHQLRYKYQQEIHCNEVSILPYYIANLNIEYTYQQKMGEYLEFKNICLVDTLDHTPNPPSRRGIKNDRKISIIIGNPPYNANQQNENDNNKNREYPTIDKRIKETYIKESTAQKTKLYDMYARFIRWGSDEISDNGIIAFVTNSSFINARTFDGFRKVVSQEFDDIYVIDLGGNIRGGDKSGNVFNIMVGVAITFFVKNSNKESNTGQIYYYKLPQNNAKDKLDFLAKSKLQDIEFNRIIPDKQHNWINLTDNDFDSLLPLANKETKLAKNTPSERAVFKLYSLGVITNRDEWVYDFSLENLTEKMTYFFNEYNQVVTKNSETNLLDTKLSSNIKWTRKLKKQLRKSKKLYFENDYLKICLYRPFINKRIYYNKDVNEMQYQLPKIIPNQDSENILILLSGTSSSKPFSVLVTQEIFCLDTLEKTQCLPLYRYENGEKTENITDWSLEQFRNYYQEKAPLSKRGWEVQITKQDIFYYVYAVLHNPKYRQKYELNLKREFPRIPFYDDFYQWVNWGKKLMNLHLNYETVKPYQLKRVDLPPLTPPFKGRELELPPLTPPFKGRELELPPLTPPFKGRELELPPLTPPFKGRELELPPLTPPFKGGNFQLKTKLKVDKTNGKIIIDEVTTLENVPDIAWKYQLGNRSAIEWILEQYKEKKPKDQTIAERFNNYRFADYKEQVIDLLMRVCTVSVETVKIIQEISKI
jgi:predicted helicase